jgi:hypothetical protein
MRLRPRSEVEHPIRLVSRLRMSGARHPLRQMSSWRVQRELYFTLQTVKKFTDAPSTYTTLDTMLNQGVRRTQ